MSNFEQKMSERRKNFLTRCRQRLQSMRERLRSLPVEQETLKAINRELHQLVGGAGIYELDEMAQVGISAEELCSRLIGNGTTCDAAALQNLEDLIARLDAHAVSDSSAGGEPAAAETGP